MTDPQDDYMKTLKQEDFGVIMKSMMGEEKRRTARFVETWKLIKAQRPKEELMVQAAFESCMFKSALSCVAGRLNLIYSPYKSLYT